MASGLGLRIRAPGNTQRQRQNQAEQVALGAELVAHANANEVMHSDSGDSDDTRLQLATYHRAIMENRDRRNPSNFIGIRAEEVSPPNPFVKFGSPKIHIVSPLSYHSTTPVELNSPLPRIGFASKRMRKHKHKRTSAKKKLVPTKRFRKLNLVKLLNKTLKKIKSRK
jgi:hypothetical protein